jgi:uncharacterized protein (DUF736 family)
MVLRKKETNMATIGYVTRKADGSYEGEVQTLAIKAPIRIAPIAKTKDNAPSFRIMSGRAHIGAAWIKQNRTDGADYVSLSFDDPSMARPLYANLGPAADQDDEDVFAIIWNRPAE